MRAVPAKPLVYLETSFISYLTARVSSNEIAARRQSITRLWWETEQSQYMPVISEIVWAESLMGDAEQVAARTAFMEPFESVSLTPEAESLADKLLKAHAIPPNSTTDALHIAIATICGARLLLTWNCRHIANSETLPKTILTIEKAGYMCPAIATPAQRLEEKQ